jgi:hypothetical protein
MRTILPFFLCGTVLGLSAGCAHMVESRVVQAFAQSLQDHDSERLIAGTSSDFESKAVKGDETFRALKMIELPEGMPQVTFVKSIKDEDGKHVVEKRVTATVGKGKDKRKLVFRLKRDGTSNRWVVDDLFLSKDDLENNKSVAMRLAVLLALQESLDAWKSGAREPILAAATPEFAQSLSGLTTLQLAQFAKKVTAEMTDTTKVESDEQIGEETSVMKVLKGDGDLILSFRRDGQRWRLDDLAVRSRRVGDDIASARLVSAAMGAALKFESAFRSSDKRVLEQVCTPSFFEGSLAPSDLAQVHLPETGPGLDDFDMKLDNARATFVVRSGSEELTISLKQQDVERLHAIPRYLVDDVTIYDLKSSQDKRLSSLFTAQATMEAFSTALARRDVETLKKHSTHDFNQRVWARTTPIHFDSLPMARLAPVKPTILQTRFKGSLTEILIEQGETPMTYVLRDEGGRMLVDDILSPATDWPESMKAAVEVLTSTLNFRAALAASNMEAIRSTASSDFTRFAWDHFQLAPQFDVNPDEFLKSPLTSISRSEGRAEVVFGNARHGARFRMVKEKDQFLVDDVTLVAGPLDRDQIGMKRAIRTQLGQVE